MVAPSYTGGAKDGIILPPPIIPPGMEDEDDGTGCGETGIPNGGCGASAGADDDGGG